MKTKATKRKPLTKFLKDRIHPDWIGKLFPSGSKTTSPTKASN